MISAITISAQTVEKKYDRFKDETTLTAVIFQKAMDADSGSVKWMLETKFAGEKATAEPKLLDMTLDITSKNGRLIDPTVRAIVDGERVTLGQLKKSSTTYVGTVIEVAWLAVPIETVRKMANAKSVEMRAGDIEIDLSADGFAKVKALLREAGSAL